MKETKDEEIVQQTVRIKKPLLWKVKVFAAKKDINLNDFYLTAVKAYLSRYGDEETKPDEND